MMATTSEGQAAGAPSDDIAWRELRIAANDGLVLSARDYGDRTSSAIPVVCLAGLTRNVRDFHELASQLARSGGQNRRVLSIDYRGRGQSEYDTDWRRYNVFTEMGDCLTVMDAAGIQHAVLVGVSRGGILAMMMAAARPGFIAGAVLVDIGPVIELDGLVTIKDYLANPTAPETWTGATDMLRHLQATSFPALTDDEWDAWARMVFKDDNGRPALDFDTAIFKTLDDLDLSKPPPVLWPQFDALATVPLLTIRGEHSTILSAATLQAMHARVPSMEHITVAGQGHAPLLIGPVAERIVEFVANRDATGAH